LTGIMQKSGMPKAMAHGGGVRPGRHGEVHAIVLGVLLHALSLLFDPLVLLRRPPGHRRGGRQLGVPKVQFAQAALLDQMTTGFPVTPLTPATFLVVGDVASSSPTISGSRFHSCSAPRSL
jgi:CitMHS family citrate-Mg2+:H+ or citrate-Ca2+:H+ symporter